MSDHNQHIDPELLEKYLNGKLSSSQQYEVERMMQASIFEEEAVDGLSELPSGEWTKDVRHLQKQVANYSAQNRQFNWYTIAAAVALFIVASFSIYLVLKTSDPSGMNDKESAPLTMKQDSTSEESAENNKDRQQEEEVIDGIEEEPLATNDQRVENTEEGTTTGPTVIDNTQQADPEPEIRRDEITTPVVTQSVTEDEPTDQLALAETTPAETEETLNEVVLLDSDLNDEEATDNLNSGAGLAMQDEASGFAEEADDSFGDISGANKTEVAKEEKRDIARRSVAKKSAATTQPITSSNQGPFVATKSVSDAGWNEYINDNLKYPEAAMNELKEGTVVLKFRVTSNGTITNIQVIQSVGLGCDEEAIRLLKEGPAWIPSQSENSEGSVSIKFSL